MIEPVHISFEDWCALTPGEKAAFYRQQANFVIDLVFDPPPSRRMSWRELDHLAPQQVHDYFVFWCSQPLGRVWVDIKFNARTSDEAQEIHDIEREENHQTPGEQYAEHHPWQSQIGAKP